MVYKINPYHQLIWRNPNSLQVGVGPKAQIIEPISLAQERLIDALYYGVSSKQIDGLARSVQLTVAQTQDLIEHLLPSFQKQVAGAVPVEDHRLAESEAIRAALDNHSDASKVISDRGKYAIHVDKLDPTGMTLALALAAAGVTSLTSRDNSKVSMADIQSGVFPKGLLGMQRFQAVKLMLESTWPTCRIFNTYRVNDKKTQRVNLAVLVNQQVTLPVQVASWRTMEIPVLEIRYQPDGVQVSPILGADVGCLNCRDHHLQDNDPAHQMIATQLATSPLRFDDAGSRLIGCGLALQQILRFIDSGGAGATQTENTVGDADMGGAAATGYEYRRDGSPAISEVRWRRHPQCGCAVTTSSLVATAART